MKFDVKKQFVLLNIDEKKSVNLYTLVERKSKDNAKPTVITTIGVKENGLQEFDLVDVTLSLKTQTEKFETEEGVKYVEVLNTFVSKISKVRA